MTVKLSEIERAAEWAVLALAEQDLAEQIARLPALTAALRDVLALHAPFEWSFGQGPVHSCRECARLGGTEDETAYPCPTVRAITAHVDQT